MESSRGSRHANQIIVPQPCKNQEDIMGQVIWEPTMPKEERRGRSRGSTGSPWRLQGGDAQSRTSRMGKRVQEIDWKILMTLIVTTTTCIEWTLNFTLCVILSAFHALAHIIQPSDRDTIVIPVVQMRILRHSFSSISSLLNSYLCMTLKCKHSEA